jgi:hypothetical protein
MVVYFLTDFSTKDEDERRSQWQEKMIHEESLVKRFTIFLSSGGAAFIIFDIIIIIAWVVGYFIHKPLFINSIRGFIYLNTLFILLFVVLEQRRKYFIVYKQKMESTFSNLLVILPVIILYVINLSCAQIDKVKNDKLYKNTTVILDNVVMHSDDLHYYVGHTKNYLFFFKQDIGQTSVIPMSRVKEIILKK